MYTKKLENQIESSERTKQRAELKKEIREPNTEQRENRIQSSQRTKHNYRMTDTTTFFYFVIAVINHVSWFVERSDQILREKSIFINLFNDKSFHLFVFFLEILWSGDSLIGHNIFFNYLLLLNFATIIKLYVLLIVVWP